jgi:hypothetical protein
MSSILYYSNFCEPSKKLLQTIGKNPSTKDIHFICIDNRVKEANGKTMIVLQNGQKILMPENVTRVPALLLLNQNYRVIYGDDIYSHFKPVIKEQVRQATMNNMEPNAFQDGFSTFSSNVASDNFSFLDQNDDELGVKGNGGLRQMHNYVSLSESNEGFYNTGSEEAYSSDRLKSDDMSMSLEKLQKTREQDLQGIHGAGMGPMPTRY